MNGKALWVVLEAKPGKEAEVEKFLETGRVVVEAEPKTVSWFAIKIGPSTYGIFDTFADDLWPGCAPEWQGSAGLEGKSV